MSTALDQAVARVCTARPGPFKSAAVRRLLWQLKMELDPKTRPQPRIELIGLTGDPGAGKDTVGHLLAAARGYVPIAFADALRREVARAWCITDLEMLTDRAVKDLPMLRWGIDQCSVSTFVRQMAHAGHDIEKPRSPRAAMQLWGEWRRAQDPAYWVKRVDDSIRMASAGGSHRFVLTDVRFRNELEYVRAHGGEAWRIVRPDAVANRTSHQSCMELLHEPLDREVHNDSTLQALAADVARVLALHDAEVVA